MRYSIDELLSGLVGAQAPSAVISTADLKEFLRVEHSEEDTLIEAMREAAIKHIEGLTNIRIGQRIAYIRYDQVYSEFEIPIGPITTTSFGIQYAEAADDPAGSMVKDTDYYVDFYRKPARVHIINVPNVYDYNFHKLKVTALVGYDAASTPPAIVHAIKLLVAHMYEMRQPEVVGTITTRVKLGLDALLNPYRIVSFR